MEDSITTKGSYSQSLGIIFEGVRRRLGAAVGYPKGFTLLQQSECRVSARTLDAARSDITRYTQMTNVGFVAHALQFTDRHVIAFVVAYARKGKISNGPKDDECGGDDL